MVSSIFYSVFIYIVPIFLWVIELLTSIIIDKLSSPLVLHHVSLTTAFSLPIYSPSRRVHNTTTSGYMRE